jgi:hypothetical protein
MSYSPTIAEHAAIKPRTAVILQPSYLPWLGYFAQIQRCDVFVVYDDVQYDKHSWRNRNRIKTAQGVQWLTVPVATHGKNKPLVRDVRIANEQDWRRKHLSSIRQQYAKAPFFDRYIGVFEDLYAREWTRLLELNHAFLLALCGALGLERDTRFSSDLAVPGASAERLIGICRTLGAACFYEGAAGRDYIDNNTFVAAGLTIQYQDYRHPEYPQLHGPFQPFLSVIDLLFNCGPDSLEILTQ